MESSLHDLFSAFSIPWIGLTSVGILAFLSATLLPLSSEIPFYAYLSRFPESVLPLIGIASLGNSLGGIFNWWLGKLSQAAIQKNKQPQHPRLIAIIQKYGPKSLLFSWVPLIGDPLSVLAGWYQLPFLTCCIYLSIGKCLRYCVIALLYFWV
jgi:membrane protein YqaA with SNARE-associated domain